MAVTNINNMDVNKELMGECLPPMEVTLCERLMSDLEMLLMGAFNPLNGFMTLSEYKGVLKNMELPNGEVFPLPMCLPVPVSSLRCMSEGSDSKENLPSISLKDKSGTIVAKMVVESLWKPDFVEEQELCLGSSDSNHPWVQYQATLGEVAYIGGVVKKTGEGVVHHDFKDLRQPAPAVKASIKEMGFKYVVGFQTRNPMHRAHFELTVLAMDQVIKETGETPLLMITPAVGPTQPGDIAPEVRVHCYQKILSKYSELKGMSEPKLVLLPLSMRMAGPREAVFHSIIRRNYGCTHFIVGRDHAGPSAKKADGSSFYGPYDAHVLMQRVEPKVGIKAILGQNVAYVSGDKGGFLPADQVPEGAVVQNVSGSDFRRMLEKFEEVPDFFSFKEVVDELRIHYRPKHQQGLVIYLTGLPCSGKSTLARAVECMIRERVGEGRKITVLDGDLVRLNLSKGLGFSKEDRSSNVRRIGFVASEVAKHRGIAIAANIAPFVEDRKFNRDAVAREGGNYFEVYVETPVSECEKRDVKDLYAKARAGVIKNFTGVSDPYEIPVDPELVVRTDCSVEESATSIIKALMEREYIQ